MRLIESSDPDEVPRADARQLLCERLALASAVCHALDDNGAELASPTSSAALSLLMDWVREHHPTDGPEALVWDGFDEMRVPPDDEALRQRLAAATHVCGRLAHFYTADTYLELQQDSWELEAALEWWRRREAALLPPPHRPARTKVQRLTLDYLEGAATIADVVEELVHGSSDSEPRPWRGDMGGWTGIVYLESAGWLNADQVRTLRQAYETAVLALYPEPDLPEHSP